MLVQSSSRQRPPSRSTQFLGVAVLAGALLVACGNAEAMHDEVVADGDVGTEALIGCWDLEISLPLGKTKNAQLCFEADTSGELGAKMFVKGEWRTAKSVRAKPGHVELVVDAPLGTFDLSADYSATTMKGTARGAIGKRPFHATRSG